LGLSGGRLFRDKAVKYSTLWIRSGDIAGGLIWRLGQPYSSGIFETGAETLETAQARKVPGIAELLELDGGESVPEIGCDWGGLSEHLASEKNAHVTALTLSPAHRAWASELPAAGGLADRIDVRLEDYRDVEGSFDRIVSIEMLEAVGETWWPTYFRGLCHVAVPRARSVGASGIVRPLRLPATWSSQYREARGVFGRR
jgi:cyclopropane-fatty-acyl-phospholipid synthase